MIKVLASLLLVTLTLAVETVLKDDPSWNYSDLSTWDIYPNCDDLTWSSPRDLTSSTTYGQMTVNWDDSMFAFLTGYQAADISESEQGYSDYTYRMKGFPDGALGGWYASEPMEYTPNFEIYFQINETRLHQPAEHSLDGVTYDAEFQLMGVDTRGQAFFCESGLAAISMLLKVDDTKTENPFWTTWLGQTSYNFDLASVIPKTYAMSYNMIGYKGGDTQPPCNKMCWYVLSEPFYISSSTLALIQTANMNAANNRPVQVTDTENFYNAQHHALITPQLRKQKNTEL